MTTRLGFFVIVLLVGGAPAHAQDNFKKTHSGKPYVHDIELYDSVGRIIDPTAPNPMPYSPKRTCMKCHDYAAIEKGYHFNAFSAGAAGRAGEPWILVDRRTGTQLPISERGGDGRRHLALAGLDVLRFQQTFARHLPGGIQDPTTYTARDAAAGRLEIDCMWCHSADNRYSHDAWATSVENLNFTWAPTAAIGFGSVEGSIKSIPAESSPSSDQIPKVTYDLRRFSPKNTVFFDIVRTPSDESCLGCHTTRLLGDSPRWTHDGDVHLRAGMSCSDCHPNGIEHHTVRGYEGEENPAAFKTSTLTCRGCHMDTSGENGGRFGAPKPLHAGLPPVHLDKLSCTACHSGPRPEAAPAGMQTSMAHALGMPSQTRGNDDLPRIVGPVFVKSESGVIEPYRQMWPSFWGRVDGDAIIPVPPKDAYAVVRRALRVRQDLTDKIGEDPGASIAKVLAAMKKAGTENAVYVAGGSAYRLDSAGTGVELFDHVAAEPVRWPLGHDVRPARHSLGASGCDDCHSADSHFMYGEVTPLAPVMPNAATSVTMSELMQQDPTLLVAWEESFAGRTPFRWVAVVSVGCIVLVLLAYGVVIVSTLRARRAPGESESTPS